MKKNFKHALTILSILCTFFVVIKAEGQVWNAVGSAGFSAGSAGNTSIAIDRQGTPYIAFIDSAIGNKITVMKFDGSNWVTVGYRGFSDSCSVEYPSIAIDGNDTPYVVYQDDNRTYVGATVKKFDGTSWITVGDPGFTVDYVEYTSIAIDKSGTPFVVYVESNIDNVASVMKFNGTKWVNVGVRGFSNNWLTLNTSIAIDTSGTPYVAYRDLDNSITDKATVMKFNGSNWVVVGHRGISSDVARYPSIAIAGKTPYIAYQDLGDLGKATVLRYNGANWSPVGSIGFSDGPAYYTSIALDTSGTPYVAYMDVTNITSHGPASVMKFDGSSWVNVGDTGFSAGIATSTSISIDKSGVPYVAYIDNTCSNKATVMKYDSKVGIQNITRGSVNMIDIFPNPNKGKFVISSSDNITTVTISNLLGQSVYDHNYYSTKVEIDVSTIPVGIYQIRINETEIRKFVKE